MSDEVSDFLRSVELLKGRREEEDEARSRELEQKILQEKAERQARRLGVFYYLLYYSTATTPLVCSLHVLSRRRIADQGQEVVHGVTRTRTTRRHVQGVG